MQLLLLGTCSSGSGRFSAFPLHTHWASYAQLCFFAENPLVGPAVRAQLGPARVPAVLSWFSPCAACWASCAQLGSARVPLVGPAVLSWFSPSAACWVSCAQLGSARLPLSSYLSSAAGGPSRHPPGSSYRSVRPLGMGQGWRRAQSRAQSTDGMGTAQGKQHGWVEDGTDY